MKRWLIKAAAVCCLMIAPLLLSYCGGSPAAPPAPPVEVPSPIVLKFVEPTDLQIDLSTVSMATTPNIAKAVGPGGEFSEEIAFGAGFSQGVLDEIFNPVLGGIGKLEIPVSTSMTTYHEVIDFGEPSEEIFVGVLLSGVHDVKISFADYDFENDGTPEGCSGHTAALPICARMWLDDVHYLAWVFETYPYFDDPTTVENDATPGRGKFKIFAYFEYTDGFPDHWSLRNDYDFEDLENALLDFFTHQYAMDGSGWGIHMRLVQTGPAATALKQVAANRAVDTDGYENPYVLWEYESNYLAQYREGYDFWSGSIKDCGTCKIKFDLQEITNQCARISTGNGTDEANCTDVGGIDIRVGDIPFLDPVDPAYVALPNDFPEAPPAGMF